ncbi:hypothetical protein [Arthrobacter sp.]|uniref:hypothetical protein n=1 Tax=Arthrobacter sp. TaxID=1667 RepID=UPI0028119172|nr:hypothetical protein [Arthrobacter sp.]
MGKISAVPAPSRAIRVSPTAWALALDAVDPVQVTAHGSTHQSAGSQAKKSIKNLDAETREDAWKELQGLGVAEGKVLSRVWADALQAVLRPVTLLRLSAAYLGIACNSDFSISGAQGVAVLRRSTIGPGNDGGLRALAHEPALEVALFDVAQIWGAIAPVLPPLAELRADAVQVRGTSDDAPRIPLSPAEAANIPEEAILSAAMTTRAGSRRQVWAARWSVSEGTLYSTRTPHGAVILTPQHPGHVAREITYALAGAYEFAAGVSASA